ncbi:MAG: DUF6427 family protein [Aestuariibaculum sp.]
MIASIFSKSKSINFVVAFIITLLAFIMARLNIEWHQVTFAFVLKQLFMLFMCYFTILIAHFIVLKNKLVEQNNLDVLIFSLFFLLFVNTTSNQNILLSNIFVLLGLRRILSLKSVKNTNSKLFDSGFWIALAVLFYFWSILFFVLVIIGSVLHNGNNLKYYLVPLLGIASVFVIGTALSVILYDDFFSIFNINPKINYDFSSYNSARYLIAITLFFSFGIWASLFYVNHIKNRKKASKASIKLIFTTASIALVIIIISPQKAGSEFLFSFAPLTIIMANYIASIQEKWFKEVFLCVLVLLPFILLLL